jgi:hypothetical protein
VVFIVNSVSWVDARELDVGVFVATETSMPGAVPKPCDFQIILKFNCSRATPSKRDLSIVVNFQVNRSSSSIADMACV